MSALERPISARFFPASRLGLAIGLVVGLGGAFVLPRMDAKAAIEPPPVVDVGAPVLPPGPSQPEPPQLVDQHGRLRGPVVLNVWLEGCADCMPAFEAWRTIDEHGDLGDIPLMNVAFGSASNDFVKKYRVGKHLVPDSDGGLVVRRFGIGSFTTLVLDERGQEIHRDRPDRPGYVERVRAAWERASGERP